MSNETNEGKRPTHAVYQVVGEGKKTRWIKIGAAFANKDGKGFNVLFDIYPSGRISLREIKEQVPGGQDGGPETGGEE